jgi:hypothetical protein
MRDTCILYIPARLHKVLIELLFESLHTIVSVVKEKLCDRASESLYFEGSVKLNCKLGCNDTVGNV